jgi:hypothetical protein
LPAALNHGAYSSDGITSYISSSGNAAGQHAHGGILNVIRDEARHFRYMLLGLQLQKNSKNGKVQRNVISKGERAKAQTCPQMMEAIEESRLIFFHAEEHHCA